MTQLYTHCAKNASKITHQNYYTSRRVSQAPQAKFLVDYNVKPTGLSSWWEPRVLTTGTLDTIRFYSCRRRSVDVPIVCSPQGRNRLDDRVIVTLAIAVLTSHEFGLHLTR